MFDVRRKFTRGAYVFALVVFTVFASPYEVGSKLSDATTAQPRPASIEDMKWPHRLPVLTDPVSKDPLSDKLLSFCDGQRQLLTKTRAANEPYVRG
ncbi:MAG: hypothetical protein WBY44_10845 [Bryobacteraceae bacterium]